MIERDELLKMAREARSWQYQDQRGDLEEGTFCFDEDSLQVFASAILERAAKHFDDRGKYSDGSWSEGWYDAESPGIILRALKTKE